MMGKNKGSIKTQRQYEKEEQSRIKIKDYFMSGQISSEVAVFILRLLGYSVTRAKQIAREWASEKSK
jgi:heme/copper-type cytochrome/quinol oxidase subunit 3